MIDTLPPGLYEAVFENKAADTANPDLVTGHWVMRCEARTLDDIRALGGTDAADERRFATAARVSEINLSLYRTFAQPVVRGLVNSPIAEWMQALPFALAVRIFSNANPTWLPSPRWPMGFVGIEGPSTQAIHFSNAGKYITANCGGA